MNILSSLALTSVGTYATISGLKGCMSKEKSKGWETAKVALGVAIVAKQVELALGEDGLVGWILSSFSKCDLYSPDQILRNLEKAEGLPGVEKDGVSNIFQVLKRTKGMTCENYLSWQDDFRSIEDISPKALDQSVMWGMAPDKRLFVAIKNTCASGNFGHRLSIYVQRALGQGFLETADKGLFHDERCMPRLIIRVDKWVTDLFQAGSVKVPLSALRSWQCLSMNCTGLFENVFLDS